jgi:hypothetical protein
MDARVVAELQSSLVGMACQSAEILHGYPFLRFGEHQSIRVQTSWRLVSGSGVSTEDIRVLEGARLTGLEVVGDLFNLRLLWDSGLVFETAPEPEDLMYERWIAHIGPTLLAGAGPGDSWFSFI